MVGIPLKIKEVYRFDGCGIEMKKSYWLQYNMTIGGIKTFSNETIEKHLLNNEVKLDTAKNHYVYYNYHPSSGYYTSIWMNEYGLPSIHIEEPKGFVLTSFWHEIIVFTIEKDI